MPKNINRASAFHNRVLFRGADYFKIHKEALVNYTFAVDDFKRRLRKTKEGDKVSMGDLKKIYPRALLAHFILWLYVGYQPADSRRSRTVLIHKTANPEGHGQFRPISISSYICRAFH